MIRFRLRTCPLVLSDEQFQLYQKGLSDSNIYESYNMTRIPYHTKSHFTIFGIEIIVKRIRIFYKNKTFNL